MAQLADVVVLLVDLSMFELNFTSMCVCVCARTEDPQDIYWLAQCLYLTSQYHRASHALRSRKLDKASITSNTIKQRLSCLCSSTPMRFYYGSGNAFCFPNQLKLCFLSTQLYGACQYLAARCHVSHKTLLPQKE